jgi:hypothetical protein
MCSAIAAMTVLVREVPDRDLLIRLPVGRTRNYHEKFTKKMADRADYSSTL